MNKKYLFRNGKHNVICINNMIPNIYIAYNIPSQIEIESIEMDVNLHDKRERARVGLRQRNMIILLL